MEDLLEFIENDLMCIASQKKELKELIKDAWEAEKLESLSAIERHE